MLALLGVSSLWLTACKPDYYKFPQFTFAGRPIPPSQLAQRVMISVTANGSQGSLQIVDALRDIRSNVQNTKPSFSIGGYSSGMPISILSFPAELRGYVYSSSDGSLGNVNYSSESSSGSVGNFCSSSPCPSGANVVAIPSNFDHYYAAVETAGVLEVIDNLTGRTFPLNLPNVFKVFANTGDTVAIAMVRNSPTLYRVFKLNANQYATQPQAIAATGSVDCQPATLPVYCVVPVPGTYDEPSNAYFSLDGTTVYVLNCGPECGGTTASVTQLEQGPLNENVIPLSASVTGWSIASNAVTFFGQNSFAAGQILTLNSFPTSTFFNGIATAVVQSAGLSSSQFTVSIPGFTHANASATETGYALQVTPSPQVPNGNIPIPGGVTAALSDGTTLYLSGQQLQSDGNFEGFLTTLNQGTNTITGKYPISDGSHSKMLFADNNTLWIGSQYCATGERAAQGANYNCLTMVTLGNLTQCPQSFPLTGKLPPGCPQVVPNVTPGSATAVVPYPNENENQYYYGSLTGLCWVQNYNKVYTAYGGQVHIFSTADGSEIDNEFVTVQGTALDVAYMDALSDGAN
jgi:hypothetical protein